MFSERISRLSGSLIREILAVAQRPEVISFAGGLPAADAMPELDFFGFPPALRQYGPSEGEPFLREAIAAQVNALGRPCSPEQVLVLSGSQQGIDLVAKLFVDPGTPVLVEAPTYLAAAQVLTLFGARYSSLTLQADGPDVSQLDAQLERDKPAFGYLIPTFQNPAGTCYSSDKRRAVADAFARHKITLVEDEPYRDLVYDPVDRTPIVSYLPEGASWVYLGTFSKTMAPGLRVAYLVCSPDLFPYLLKLRQAGDLHTNRVGQWVIHKLLTNGGYDAHMERLRAYYKTKRDAMESALETHFGDIATWVKPAGGLFFWIRLNERRRMLDLLPKALERNVAFMPGEPFYAQKVEATGEFRLNFSHASEDKIDEGLRILREVIG